MATWNKSHFDFCFSASGQFLVSSHRGHIRDVSRLSSIMYSVLTMHLIHTLSNN